MMKHTLLALFVALCGCTEEAYVNPPAGTYRTESYSLRTGGSAVTVATALVRDAFFSEAHVQPMLGRFFVPDEYGGSGRVAVLSNALWKRQFGGDPGLIGRTVQLNGLDCTIVGVLPERFSFPPGVDVWMPM